MTTFLADRISNSDINIDNFLHFKINSGCYARKSCIVSLIASIYEASISRTIAVIATVL